MMKCSIAIREGKLASYNTNKKTIARKDNLKEIKATNEWTCMEDVEFGSTTKNYASPIEYVTTFTWISCDNVGTLITYPTLSPRCIQFHIQ